MAASALRRLGDSLLRRAETDPRLARAVEQGYDLGNPLVHGTNKELKDKKLQHLFLTDEPDMSLNYTGGGRRAGPGAPGKGPMTVPLLLRGKPRATDLDAFEKLPYEDPSWVSRLGIQDPEAFQARVRALRAAEPVIGDWVRDPYWGIIGLRPGAELDPRHLDKQFFEYLDSPAFRQVLLESDVPSLDFAHDYTVNDISPKGRVTSTRTREPGRAVLSVDPSGLRSPWAQFKKEGVGLMKKRGGLAKACDCGK
jgi:hypothetical protein